MADLIKKGKDLVQETFLAEIEDMIKKLESAMDELTVEEKKLTEEALVKLKVSEVELGAIRITLRALATETIRQVGVLKRLMASMKPSLEDKSLLIRLKVLF